MIIRLGNAEGGREFIDRVVRAASEMALALVGQDDTRVRAVLDRLRPKLEADLRPIIGANAAIQVADGFAGAVAGEKRRADEVILRLSATMRSIHEGKSRALH